MSLNLIAWLTSFTTHAWNNNAHPCYLYVLGGTCLLPLLLLLHKWRGFSNWFSMTVDSFSIQISGQTLERGSRLFSSPLSMCFQLSRFRMYTTTKKYNVWHATKDLKPKERGLNSSSKGIKVSPSLYLLMMISRNRHKKEELLLKFFVKNNIVMHPLLCRKFCHGLTTFRWWSNLEALSSTKSIFLFFHTV